MDQIWEYIKQPFGSGLTVGLLLGLAVAIVAWKSGFSARRRLGRDLRRLENELRELQSHLNTQLKINASGNDTLQKDLEELRRQNENLRVSVATLQTKPGRAEIRHFQITETAVRMMREQAPGFAPAWEKAFRQAEVETEASESGLKKLVRMVMPGIGMNATTASTTATHDSEN